LKVFIGGESVNFADRVKEAEKKLKSEKILNLTSTDQLDGVATYLAWREVGGTVICKNPMLPKEHSDSIDEKLKDYDIENKLVLHTSGTTGLPKVVLYSEETLDQSHRMSCTNKWHNKSNFLSLFPNQNLGFWTYAMSNVVAHDCDITLIRRENLVPDLMASKCTQTFLFTPFFDVMKGQGFQVDFSTFEEVSLGGAKVTERHAQYAFDGGAGSFSNMFGTTEASCPLLKRHMESMDDWDPSLILETFTDNYELKMDGEELLVRGANMCANADDFLEDGWFRTGDMFDVDGKNITFTGRKNEWVKINGNKSSLLLIEDVTERAGLGETMAVIRNLKGIDYVELYHSASVNVDKNEMKEKLKDSLPDYCIPRKFTHIETIPRNAIGKKVRNHDQLL